jgi:hypothetical protein
MSNVAPLIPLKKSAAGERGPIEGKSFFQRVRRFHDRRPRPHARAQEFQVQDVGNGKILAAINGGCQRFSFSQSYPGVNLIGVKIWKFLIRYVPGYEK